MKYSIQEIGKKIKQARLERGFSQREFGQKIGMPQSHLSKIENGLVDLQTSSLIEIARALELELMLVPKILLPAFQHLINGKMGSEQVPAYRLEETDDDESSIEL